jgi:Brp/Blh family beta-carotene 15,15'-monooxygenase
MALLALAIGVPHGSLDHLVTLPRTTPIKMALFIVIYVVVALLAIWAILKWNVVGFILVVLMSSIHFGVGDGAFIAEGDVLTGRTTRFSLWAYAPVAGAIPVLIPLLNDRSTSALMKVNPQLINWDHGYGNKLLVALAIATAFSLSILIIRKRYQDALDICLLLLLAISAPPLVAFATYFGCWHAMRHTARLSSLLPNSQRAYESGRPLKAFSEAVIPGLPAIFGLAIFVLALASISKSALTDHFLWLTLVTIWALTVPHMAVTAKIDRAALKK